jgi:hypothetical protein
LKSPRKKGWIKIDIAYHNRLDTWRAKFKNMNELNNPMGYYIFDNSIKVLLPWFSTEINNKTPFSVWIKITPIE